MYEVELYKEDGKFCAYIGTDGASGYKIAESTIEEFTKAIGEYFADEIAYCDEEEEDE